MPLRVADRVGCGAEIFALIKNLFRKAGGAKIGDRSPCFLIWTPIAVALKKVGIAGASKFWG
jgi:hypothetical protein